MSSIGQLKGQCHSLDQGVQGGDFRLLFKMIRLIFKITRLLFKMTIIEKKER